MSYSAAQLLKIAKREEKLGETSAAFDAYSEVLNNFPSNITALRRRFDLDLLRKREPTTKSKESPHWEVRANKSYLKEILLFAGIKVPLRITFRVGIVGKHIKLTIQFR